ncbi:hypothetical protein [Parafrankia sp. FMc2]|uniref:hypothetical protein n=1 Tax=Parafrankia sp. FMc2 TaxID=3233196 RepID=UPI0034D3CE9B
MSRRDLCHSYQAGRLRGLPDPRVTRGEVGRGPTRRSRARGRVAHPGEVRCARTEPDITPDPSGHARGHNHGHRSNIDTATHLGADTDADTGADADTDTDADADADTGAGRDGTGTSDSDQPDTRKHDTE